LRLTGGGDLAKAFWTLGVSKEGGPSEQVEMNRTMDYRRGRAPEVSVEAGESLVGFAVVWFRATGDVPEERSLVFREPGKYKLRIDLRVDDASPPEQSLNAFTDWTITVTGGQGGFSKLVRGLRGIMEDNAVVRYGRYAKELEGLIEGLADTPYAIYVKWLRVRSFLHLGEPYELAEHRSQTADKEFGYLKPLVDELIGATQENASVMLQDALAVRGIIQLYEGDLEAARETLKRMERLFPLGLTTRGFKERLE
jgi:hypothetical protein